MAQVEQIHKKGELTEQRICRFAESGKFDETTAALSLLTDLPIGAIERALVHDTGDQILVLAKSIDLSWKTTRAILAVCSGVGGELPEYFERYKRLRPETARAAIQFYRLRERASKVTEIAPRTPAASTLGRCLCRSLAGRRAGNLFRRPSPPSGQCLQDS